MQTVTTSALRGKLTKIIKVLDRKKDQIVITKHGKNIAILTPIPNKMK